MPKPSGSKRRGAPARAIVVATMAVLAIVGTRALAKPRTPPLRFDTVFSDRHEPAALHFEATYRSGGAMHKLSLWRRGATHLHRRTDDSVDSYVERARADDPEFRMTVLDGPRKIATTIDRTNLYRIGNFTDWFDLAHGLRHPKGEYALAHAKPPAGAAKPIARCDWYDLSSGGRDTRICWSARLALPVLIYVLGADQPDWQLQSVSTQPIAAQEFAYDDRDYVRNDANQDIERD